MQNRVQLLVGFHLLLIQWFKKLCKKVFRERFSSYIVKGNQCQCQKISNHIINSGTKHIDKKVKIIYARLR